MNAEETKFPAFLKAGLKSLFSVSEEERDYAVENLALLVSSGTGILSALEAIESELRSRRIKDAFAGLKDDVENGVSLWRALKNTGLFPAHVVSLVKIGEESGRLSETLKTVVDQRQKERVFRAKVRSAMMYPVFVLVMALFIGSAVALFVLPRLALVFSQLKLEPPLITKALIAAGKFLAAYGLTAIPFFLGISAIAVYFAFVFPKTKFAGQALLLKLPAIKKILKEIELARMGYVLGTLLEAGLPIVDALNSLSETASLRPYEKFYVFLRDGAREGNSFRRSFALYSGGINLVPAPIRQMIVAGEQSGRLPETFLKIGEIFENKTETSAKNLTVILEPLLLVVVWAGVVAIALAIILPIYDLISGFGQRF